MRVALVSVHTSPLEQPATGDAGGLNVLVLELAQQLAQLGHAVTLIAPRCADTNQGVVLPAGVSYLEVDASPGLLPESESEARTALFVETLTTLLEQVDVVHSHYWLSAIAVEQALRSIPEEQARRVTHVTSLHTLGAEKQLHGTEFADPLRIAAENTLIATVPVIAISSSEALNIQQHSPSQTTSVTVISPGVDTELFSPPANSHSFSARLVCVGRIQPFKGQDFALEVFDDFQRLLSMRSSPQQAELMFVGSATPRDIAWYESLRLTAKQMGLERQVRFLGAQSREATAAIVAESFFTIIPSLSETFGLVALESAACGTPSIAQNVGGLAESIDHGVSGILMNNREPSAWASALSEFAENASSYEKLRQTAHQFASIHSWRETAQKHIDVYARLRSASQ
jgi:D-inositol-3-phosphate glycosyltransferase